MSRNSFVTRLHQSVEQRTEAQVLAAHLADLNRAEVLVLLRDGDHWRIEGKSGVELANGTSIPDARAWLLTQTGHDWIVHDLQYGRRTIGCVALDRLLRRAATALACAVAAPFLAASHTGRSHARLPPDLELAGLVHDLKQPLAVMRLSLSLMEQTRETTHLERCRRGVDNMQRLVEQLLVESAERSSRCAVELSSVVAEVATDLELVARARQVNICLRASCRPVVTSDRTALVRAITNLAQNAVEHSPAGHTVELTVGEVAGGAFVEVRDEGPGIAPELRERVFEPFYTTRQGGTGIGLAVTRSIVEASGGSVRFVDGGGAVACINLPLAPHA
jgi:signal transduction histidine kinase